VGSGPNEIYYNMPKMQFGTIYAIELECLLNGLPWQREALKRSLSVSISFVSAFAGMSCRCTVDECIVIEILVIVCVSRSHVLLIYTLKHVIRSLCLCLSLCL